MNTVLAVSVAFVVTAYFVRRERRRNNASRTPAKNQKG